MSDSELHERAIKTVTLSLRIILAALIIGPTFLC